MNKATARTYRERLYDLAETQHGFVTTVDARKLGIPAVELRKLAHRGKLENVSRGVYRFRRLSGSENENYLQAILAVGEDAFLTRDAVLSFHNLAQVNPRLTRIGTRRRVRQNLPNQISVTKEYIPESEIEIRDGVRMTRVARAIIESKGLIPQERLRDGLRKGIDLGLITREEANEARRELSKK